MRYEDWDILLFPQGEDTPPMKEFNTACYVVHDAEFSQTSGSCGLPTLCCYVPSLPAGMPFKISIHSWTPPALSQFTKMYSMHPEDAKFEFRVFIDGQLVASATLDRDTNGPHVIAHCFNFAQNGDFGPLKFPMFQKEILQQRDWSADGNLGRIKVVISEGFPRDSLSTPIERVRNIVAFSFQHAPLEILQSSSIAWPNPSMWQRAPYASSLSVPAYPSDDPTSHAHSPRRRTLGLQAASQVHGLPGFDNFISNNSGRRTLQGLGQSDSPNKFATGSLGFGSTDPVQNFNPYFDWLTNMDINMPDVPLQPSTLFSKTRRSRKTSTDVSMPDFSSNRNVQESIPAEGLFSFAAFQTEEDDISSHSRVPSNTPTTTGEDTYGAGGLASTRSVDDKGTHFPISSRSSAISSDIADSLTSYLLNQASSLPCRTPSIPVSLHEPRSRKEARMCPSTLSAAPSSLTLEGNRQERQPDFQQIAAPSVPNYKNSSIGSRTMTPKSLNNPGPNQKSPLMAKYSDKMIKEGQENVLEAVQASSDNGTRRFRHVTPSAQVRSETSNLRRDSPRVPLAPFAEVSSAKPEI